MNIWTSSGDRLFTRSKVHHSEVIKNNFLKLIFLSPF